MYKRQCINSTCLVYPTPNALISNAFDDLFHSQNACLWVARRFGRKGLFLFLSDRFHQNPSFFLRGMKLLLLLKTWCSSCTVYEEPGPTVDSYCVPGIVTLLSFVFHNILVLNFAKLTKVLELRTRHFQMKNVESENQTASQQSRTP